jgi:ribokinase
MKHVFDLGSLNMDVVINVSKMPELGETVSGDGFLLNSGGKGANQAVACAKQGVKCSLIGSVGADVFGHTLLKTLKGYGVDIKNVSVLPDISTGVAVITVENGDNRIILDSGANGEIIKEQIDDGLKKAKPGDLFFTQMENNQAATLYSLKTAHQKKMTVLFNPSPVAPLPDEIYENIDYLILNEHECERLTGIYPSDLQQIRLAYKKLHGCGLDSLLVTLGGSGSVLISEKKEIIAHALKIKPVDTTGAGDTFLGVFASELAQGKASGEAMEYASVCSGLTCLKKGAQMSFPTAEEAKDYIKKNHPSLIL